MVLLNPGPVNVSERVRQALVKPDICHRESEFSELLHRIQTKLLTAFVPGAESEYVAVLMTGSGTAAVEAAGMAEELWHLPTLEEAPPDGGWFSYSPMGSFSTFTAATLEDPSGDAADAGDEDG